jgi:hypothetical protein
MLFDEVSIVSGFRAYEIDVASTPIPPRTTVHGYFPPRTVPSSTTVTG